MSTVAPEKATYKPGDMSWAMTNQINAGNADGMQKQERRCPSLHTWRGYWTKVGDVGGYG